MKYQNNGKQVLHVELEAGGVATETHIADAANEETAHFLATVANEHNPSIQYMADAAVTLSPSWYGDKVAEQLFRKRLNDAIDAANKLDQVKKTLFYGRDNNLIADGQKDVIGLPAAIDGFYADPRNIVHAIIGMFTEAGELLEALRESLNGNGLDPVNLREEVGDLFWYVAILFNEMNKEGAQHYTFEDAMRVNIAKLKKRFPASFEADYANNRDLAGEREVLEGKLEDSFNGFNTDVDVVKNPLKISNQPSVDRSGVNEPHSGDAIDMADRIKAATGADRVGVRNGPIGDCEGMDC
jgi:NTP pyrophosphatase (non-canonical NTP hydrolase)